MTTTAKKKATYYLAGNCYQGDADLYMFTCWNADQTTCGRHSVYGSELQANIDALTRMGYSVENLDKRVEA